MLEPLVVVHGRPAAILLDNGPAVTAQAFVDGCAGYGVAIPYIQPGKPDRNAYHERLNRTYRTEVLNAPSSNPVAEVQAITDAWLFVHNLERPQDSLGRAPPLTC